MSNEFFNLIVRSREGVVYKGQVTSITSYNNKGMFDVLATHTNFISLIQKKLLIIDSENKKSEIEVNNALLRVKENNVEVYVGVEKILPY
ncbi:hypothetical protein A2955_05070 [Candidatus Woesebacteria bacterium RIFCSPLOWO2_01_FULL_37_19]|uniref:ATP synthase F1 complex delta/epsilon subunit N-terminal domain-containing protein n=2 Tax=Candidatus Woeseibacteriota TaxID=1752722 RepID=A0A1F8B002_9BACT|nr:MAG: hypothetical protein A2771_03275 [Candidatus Woesebacteria bacterium RIFCSPHIGHO2_01_FULL_38_26b]OGM57337.1 MAG: hypothetical protein A2955_05070 [Candidatus Woesebacteria bacterium RIFCSPLOWO2_01_FULL_37_19]